MIRVTTRICLFVYNSPSMLDGFWTKTPTVKNKRCWYSIVIAFCLYVQPIFNTMFGCLCVYMYCVLFIYSNIFKPDFASILTQNTLRTGFFSALIGKWKYIYYFLFYTELDSITRCEALAKALRTQSWFSASVGITSVLVVQICPCTPPLSQPLV